MTECLKGLIGRIKTATGRMISLIKEAEGKGPFEYPSDLANVLRLFLETQIKVSLLYIAVCIVVCNLFCLR